MMKKLWHTCRYGLNNENLVIANVDTVAYKGDNLRWSEAIRR
jgi:hypothetical protein